MLDDVRIYNRALSATEIEKLYTLTDKVQGGDCTDTNNQRHPLAIEVCDGVDNDCDGQIDEKPGGGTCGFCERIDLNVSVLECEALQALYTGTVGSSWTIKTNWLSNPDVSTWYGVTLTGAGAIKNVSALVLPANNIVGTLPVQMSNLLQIKQLVLNNNAITALGTGVTGIT